MEAMQLHRGRLIDHVQLVVEDLPASRKFYAAIFDILGIPIVDGDQGFFWADEFVVSTADSPAAKGKLTGRVHLAFQAPDKKSVDTIYRAGLANGGTDNGPPGDRTEYHPGYYAAFLLDPDGNNIEAVYHGEHERSADSIVIDFEM